MLSNPDPNTPVILPVPCDIAAPIEFIAPDNPDVTDASGLPPPLAIAATVGNAVATLAKELTLATCAAIGATLLIADASGPAAFARPPIPPAMPPMALKPNPPLLIAATIHAIYFIHTPYSYYL